MYEIYGLKLGDRDVESSIVFLHTDPGKLVGNTYYMWCIKSKDTLVLVDTGMSDQEEKKRSLTNVTSPVALLNRIGVNPEDVKTVIVTHSHGDHVSAFNLYPNATFYIQKKEIEFFSTVDVKNKALIFAVTNVADIVRLNYDGRVKWIDGDEEILPGILLAHVGAHTPGSQVVAVKTSLGTVVLCADLIDYYRNLEEHIPIGLVLDVGEWYSGIEKVRKLASSPNLIIPGHDPLNMERFPKAGESVIRIGKN